MRKILAIAAFVGVVVFAVMGLGIANATTTGPTVYEQRHSSSPALFAVYPATTTITTSPVLATGFYVVNAVVTVGHVNPGLGATCGIKTAGGSSDLVSADTGQLGNGNTSGSFLDGNCVITGAVHLTVANDTVSLWVAATNGSGATLDNSSINETPIGTFVLTH
jgi:hypothetical protein